MQLPRRLVALVVLLLASAVPAEVVGEVVRIEITRRDDFPTYERLIGRVHFATDPLAPANRAIVDIEHAPRNPDGRVESVSDLLLFRPKDQRRARGTVFLEVVNRGRDQFLGLLSGAVQRNLTPEAWSLGDRFLLEQGFTVAFLGWQFDVPRGQGLRFETPVAPVEGDVRADAVVAEASPAGVAFSLPYCAVAEGQAAARLTFRTRIEALGTLVPRDRWRFERNGCLVSVAGPTPVGVFEATYRAYGSPVAGLGLAALRDFASYLKHGARDAALDGVRATRVLGAGYSQSGRLLRQFVRDGFNADERGRIAFDGMLVSSAGAGGGSFNHRFAMPGHAGNSVLSILRPVDVPPFLDAELLTRARATGTVPRIFYTFTSTEYWARAGSLTHTSEDGAADRPLADSSRLYFVSGSPHAAGPLPPARETGAGTFTQRLNFASQRWILRAITLSLDAWVTAGTTPPASRYPTLATGDLAERTSIRPPRVPGLAWPGYMPGVWRLDFGPRFAAEGIIAEPPQVGAALPVLVPLVDGDGIDVGGIRPLEVAVPLGTFTGWNVTRPALPDLRYLSGLTGSFEPFARTREARVASGDARPSIAERYVDERGYVRQLEAAARSLVDSRFLLAEDLERAVERARELWPLVAEAAR
jgi:hypothetical protein